MKGLIYVEKSVNMDNSNYNDFGYMDDDSLNVEEYCSSLRAEFAGKESLEQLFASATAQMVALQRCRRPTDTVILMLEHLTGILGDEIINRMDRDDSTGTILAIAMYFMIGYVAAAREPSIEKYIVFDALVNKLLEDINKRTENKGGI